MANAHAYVPPTIAASGITWTQLLTGPEAHLEAFISALSAGTSAPSAAVTWSATGGGSSGGSLAAGTYYCVITESNGIGETTASPVSAQITVSATNQPQITFATVKTGNNSRNVYLGAPGGASTGPFFLYQLGVASSASTLTLTAAAPTDSSGAMTPPATNGTIWSIDKLQLIRFVKTGQLQKVWAWYRRQLASYNRAKTYRDQIEKVRDAGFVFSILAELVAEAGSLLVANPGHITLAQNTIGIENPVRTFP
jgi:hypothetical protein